jgi:hypothetical protein
MSVNNKYIIQPRVEAIELENIQFSTANPNTVGTVFNPNTPQTENKIYVSDVNGTTWIWNGTAYIGKTFPVQKYLGQGMRIWRNAAGSASGAFPMVIPYTVVDYSNGNLVSFDITTRSLKLTAGYIYKISAGFYSTFTTSGHYADLNFRVSTDNVTFTEPTPNRIRSLPATNGSYRSSQFYNWVYIVADVNKWVNYAVVDGNATIPLDGSATKLNYLSAFVIGKL